MPAFPLVHAHNKLLELQSMALQTPSSETFEAVVVHEAAYFELVAVKEALLKQKSRISWLNEGGSLLCRQRLVGSLLLSKTLLLNSSPFIELSLGVWTRPVMRDLRLFSNLFIFHPFPLRCRLLL